LKTAHHAAPQSRSGASTGAYEPSERRDGDKARAIWVKGVLKPCVGSTARSRTRWSAIDATEQVEIDGTMIELGDGTENKGRVGAKCHSGRVVGPLQSRRGFTAPNRCIAMSAAAPLRGCCPCR